MNLPMNMEKNNLNGGESVMSGNIIDTEYSVMELLQELMSDSSWEIDEQKRAQIVYGLLYTLIS